MDRYCKLLSIIDNLPKPLLEQFHYPTSSLKHLYIDKAWSIDTLIPKLSNGRVNEKHEIKCR